MCTFDTELGSQTMAPSLSTDEKLAYISREREFIEEILKDARDCKWVYQALIECHLLRGKLEGSVPAEAKADIQLLLLELKKLDPLRLGRWQGLERLLLK